MSEMDSKQRISEKELELEVAVKYCVEYVKQEAFVVDRHAENKSFCEENNENGHDDDEEKDWNEIEYKQYRIKQNVLKWLTSEKNI